MSVSDGHTANISSARHRPTANLEIFAGAAILISVAALTVLAPTLAPADPLKIDILTGPVAPFTDGHLLGTDDLGRDLWTRVLYGGRATLATSVTGAILGTLTGAVLAAFAAQGSRATGQILSRLADAQLAIPSLILAIVLTAFAGYSATLVIVTVILATWVTPFRVCRSLFRTVLTLPYIEASRIGGLGALRIARYHLAPVVLPQLAIIGTLSFQTALMLVSSLSYLGLGVQPPAPEWGRMVAEGQGQIGMSWWISVFPGLAIVITLVGAQLLGDGLARYFSLSEALGNGTRADHE